MGVYGPSFREKGTWEYMGLLKNATEPQGLSEWQWNNMWGASWLECCKNIVAEWQMGVKYFMLTCAPVSLMTNWKYKSIHIYWNRKRFHNHVVLWVLQISDAESSCSALLRSVLCDEKCSKLCLVSRHVDDLTTTSHNQRSVSWDCAFWGILTTLTS